MFQKTVMQGQKILVTGGGTGLGRGMAERFAELGANVVLAGRRKAVLDAAAEEIRAAHGAQVDTFALDIRSSEMVDEVMGEIWAAGPLTGLVNNAAGNFIARTEDISPKGFEAITRIVINGTFYCTHAAGRRWIEAGTGGNVLSITTTWVRNGAPFVVPSAMSKSAVHAMTMSLASEWGRYGIRLNTIAPGEIPTEGMSKRLNPGEKPGERTARINPLGRCGTIEELANLATFLMSGGCDWLTGETIAMDGAQALATGGSFYELRAWGDAEWQAARASIETQNQKDRTGRSG